LGTERAGGLMEYNDPGTPVRILGEEYRIAGASPERVRALALFVEEKFQELRAARPLVDIKRLAVAVCLNIAEELWEERTRREAEDGNAVGRVRRCRKLLEDVRAEGGEPAGKPPEGCRA
jgi:cell division protein ZapA (FtsZ GTPase activity inhibitor)